MTKFFSVMSRLSYATLGLCSILAVAACSGGSVNGGFAPPVQLGNAGNSAPPPTLAASCARSRDEDGRLSSPVSIVQVDLPRTPAGGIAVGTGGAVYLNGPNGLMECAKTFREFPYPVPQFADRVFSGTGPTSLVSGPDGSIVGLILISGDFQPTGGIVKFSPNSGALTETGASDQGDVFTAVAPAASATWAVELTPAVLNSGNALTQIFTLNSALQPIADFLPPVNPVRAETLGRDGMLYVATDPLEGTISPPASQVFRVNPVSGQVLSTITLPSNSAISQLAAGTDGSVWFTDAGLNKIGRIEAGSVTFYAVPTLNSGLSGITVGFDKAAWFTETNANKIGRVNETGTVTEYEIPTPNSRPQGIASASPGDGNPHTLFFADASGVGRVTFRP